MHQSVILKHIVQLANAPLRILHKNDLAYWRETACLTPDERPTVPLPEQALQFAQEDATLPTLATLDGSWYIAMLPFSDSRCLLGPVRLSSPLFMRRTLPGTVELDTSSVCDVPVFLQAVLLPWNLQAEKEMLPQELIALNCIDRTNAEVQEYYTRLTYANHETGSHHNAYSQELRMLESIERGDLQLLIQCQKEDVSAGLGRLSTNGDRSYRNVSIAAIVLASRAAIKGGVSPEAAFSMCDSYVMKIEALTDLRMLKPLVEGAQNNFAAMVHFRQQESDTDRSMRHPMVEKAKNYVFDHLHDRITLNDTARQIGANANYLSALFKSYEGLSFSDFVLREKITLAKSLLVYSQFSCGEIASTLSFSSQSHMGQHFKRLTGLTPVQFQRQFGITEFVPIDGGKV